MDKINMSNIAENIDNGNVDNAIEMLNKHTNEDCIKPLISILEELKQDPENESLLVQLNDIWRNLGICQGTALTYVPYFFTLIPDDIFGED